MKVPSEYTVKTNYCEARLGCVCTQFTPLLSMLSFLGKIIILMIAEPYYIALMHKVELGG